MSLLPFALVFSGVTHGYVWRVSSAAMAAYTLFVLVLGGDPFNRTIGRS